MDVRYAINHLHHTDLLKQAALDRLAQQVTPAPRCRSFRLPGWLKWPLLRWTPPAALVAVLWACCDA